MEIEEQLILDLGRLSSDPVSFVRWAFPWGGPGLEKVLGPEPWQLAVLESIRDGLKTPEAAIREAVVSGNGVGKSALVSWIILWATTTFPDTRGVVTSNTETQLKTKTWAELGKWFHLFIAKQFFTLTATALFSKDPNHERTWRVDMVPWSERNVVAFQGLHNQGKRLFLVMDEASGIADPIWDAAEGCFTDLDTEMLWLVCGNPNQPTGRFRECFAGGKFAHRWNSHKVDSRTVSFSNKNETQKWIDDYGDDHDFVRVRVKGEFPRVGAQSFISVEAVKSARTRDVEPLSFEALVMGVDVARFGDDASCITFRHGRDARSIPPIILRSADTMQVAAKVAELVEAYQPDAIFVDGGGVGGGVVDRLRQLRIHVFDVQFGAKADRNNLDDQAKYANKRAEMWGWMRGWLNGGAIPDNDQYAEELTGPQYGYNNQEEIQLESKKDMKKRGLSSPDWADSLALTFAYPVMPADRRRTDRAALVQHEYNPFDLQHIGA